MIVERRAKRERLREILKPTPVEKEKFPRWFRLRRGDYLPRVFDHWGRTMVRGGHYALVAEPYFTAMCEERWEQVRRFAIKYDLTFMVQPNSYHEPGDTLRIVFGREDWCRDLMPWCPPKPPPESEE
jgi:hypothetical protein